MISDCTQIQFAAECIKSSLEDIAGIAERNWCVARVAETTILLAPPLMSVDGKIQVLYGWKVARAITGGRK